MPRPANLPLFLHVLMFLSVVVAFLPIALLYQRDARRFDASMSLRLACFYKLVPRVQHAPHHRVFGSVFLLVMAATVPLAVVAASLIWGGR